MPTLFELQLADVYANLQQNGRGPISANQEDDDVDQKGLVEGRYF